MVLAPSLPIQCKQIHEALSVLSPVQIKSTGMRGGGGLARSTHILCHVSAPFWSLCTIFGLWRAHLPQAACLQVDSASTRTSSGTSSTHTWCMHRGPTHKQRLHSRAGLCGHLGMDLFSQLVTVCSANFGGFLASSSGVFPHMKPDEQH